MTAVCVCARVTGARYGRAHCLWNGCAFSRGELRVADGLFCLLGAVRAYAVLATVNVCGYFFSGGAPVQLTVLCPRAQERAYTETRFGGPPPLAVGRHVRIWVAFHQLYVKAGFSTGRGARGDPWEE